MNQDQKPSQDTTKPQPNDTALERLARKIVPPSTEVDDKDLNNPGQMTPDAPPTDNRS